MDQILEIAARHGVPVVEDNAHGLFGSYRGRPLGSFGVLGTLSFHETKNISCGEGGALLVNDPALVARAEIIREKGTDRAAFFRGDVDKYTWVDIGSSYLPSEILAAFLWAQLEAAGDIQQRRRTIWTRYAQQLAGWAAAHDVALPHVPAHCEHPAHMFYLLLPSSGDRDALIAYLRERRITSVFHYVPLHSSPMGRRMAPGASCPVSEEIASRLLRLPFFTELDEAVQDEVIEAVAGFSPSKNRGIGPEVSRSQGDSQRSTAVK
jgi:dTDP-4-amino-4,6-dideoxygalactose transaminase